MYRFRLRRAIAPISQFAVRISWKLVRDQWRKSRYGDQGKNWKRIFLDGTLWYRKWFRLCMLRRRRQLARHCGETVVRLAWFGIMALGWRAVAVAERNLCRCYAAALPNLPDQPRLKRRWNPRTRRDCLLSSAWMCVRRVLVGQSSPPHFQCGDTGAHRPHRIYNNAAGETGDRLEPVVGVVRYSCVNKYINRYYK